MWYPPFGQAFSSARHASSGIDAMARRAWNVGLRAAALRVRFAGPPTTPNPTRGPRRPYPRRWDTDPELQDAPNRYRQRGLRLPRRRGPEILSGIPFQDRQSIAFRYATGENAHRRFVNRSVSSRDRRANGQRTCPSPPRRRRVPHSARLSRSRVSFAAVRATYDPPLEQAWRQVIVMRSPGCLPSLPDASRD